MPNLSNLNCILIANDNVKQQMKVRLGELSSYGVTILNSIRDLTKRLVNETNKVLILGYYEREELSDLEVFKDALGLELYLLSNDRLFCELLKNLCKVYLVDYTNVSSSMIFSILYEDRGEYEKFKLDDRIDYVKNNVNSILDSNPPDYIRILCQDYLRLRDLSKIEVVKSKDYINEINSLQSKLLSSFQENKRLSNALETLISDTIEQNRILKDFNILFSKDYYDSINSLHYKERPIILYFKEYEEMIHENSFLHTLFYCFQRQAKKSCKVVRFHDSCDMLRIKKLEKRYHIVNNSFLESEIVNNDFILSYGGYKSLVDFLLKNKYKLDILIILDCKRFERSFTPIIKGDVLSYNICRNSETRDILNLDKVNTIVNNSKEDLLSWDTYKEYKKYDKKDSDKFLFLASRNVITNIYDTVLNT